MDESKGYIKLFRDMASSQGWVSEPFTRSHAWIDLLILASWKPSMFRIRGNRVDVKRGELAWSILKLGERWKWSRGKVKRFLSELGADGQIEQRNTSLTTLIYIVNYDKHQSKQTLDNTTDGQQTDTFKEVKKIKQVKKVKEIKSSASGEAVEFYRTKKGRKLKGEKLAWFNLFWSVFDYKNDKASATDAWLDIENLGNELFEKIMVGAEAEAKFRYHTDKIPKMAQGWLSGKRWEDDIKPPPPKRTKAEEDTERGRQWVIDGDREDRERGQSECDRNRGRGIG